LDPELNRISVVEIQRGHDGKTALGQGDDPGLDPTPTRLSDFA
jgi:hypothetical protein